MIEIKQFDGKSITPKDDALMYDLLFNGYGIFNGCSVSFLGANQLLVSSGRLIVRGRQVVITEETIAAQLSSDGTKKGRLYIHIDLSSTSTPIEFRTIVADTLPPLVQEDDVNYTDGIFEVELCCYDVSETAISNITETCPSITGGVDLLRNIEEVMANTTPGKAADALVVKELNESLGGLHFGTDGEGNVGYFGADGSLIPFKKGSGTVKGSANLQSVARDGKVTNSSFTLNVEEFSQIVINITEIYGDTVGKLNVTTDTGGLNESITKGIYTYDISNANTITFAFQLNISIVVNCIFTYELS